MYKFFDKLIDKLLKLPKAVVFILLGLSFVYANVFDSMQLPTSVLIMLFGNINIYLSVFLVGLVYWLLFELFAALYFWVVKSMMSVTEVYKNKAAMTNILRWFFLVRNIVFGSIRLLYFRYPLAVLQTENILLFALELASLILFYFYVRKKYLPPQLYPRSVIAFCAPYLLFLIVTMMMNCSGGLI